jgi:hypothetical protein
MGSHSPGRPGAAAEFRDVTAERIGVITGIVGATAAGSYVRRAPPASYRRYPQGNRGLMAVRHCR